MATAFKTFNIKKLDNGYEKISYTDRKFYNRFIKTDEWWNLKYLPGDHDYFEFKKFINQLQVYSEEHKNPPVVEWEISVRSVRLQETPFIQTHEDTNRLLHLDEIIIFLRRVLSKIRGVSFVYDASLICKARKSKVSGKRKRTHIPRGLRKEVFKRDNYKCVECGASKEDGATLHVDHKIPVSKGGTDELDNLQTLCSKCNLNKSDVIQ